MSASAFPDLSLQLSKQSSSVSGGGGLYSTFDIPFSFDHSGWNVASHSSGDQSATGSTGQGSGTGGGLGGLGGILAGINPNMLVIAAVAYLVLRKKN